MAVDREHLMRETPKQPAKGVSLMPSAATNAVASGLPHLLTIPEAAAYLNVPKRWVTEAIRTNRVRYTRLGKHVRFRPEHLDELIAAGEQPVLTPAAGTLTAIGTRSSARARL